MEVYERRRGKATGSPYRHAFCLYAGWRVGVCPNIFDGDLPGLDSWSPLWIMLMLCPKERWKFFFYSPPESLNVSFGADSLSLRYRSILVNRADQPRIRMIDVAIRLDEADL